MQLESRQSLFYQLDANRRALPAWASFWMDLGRAVGSWERPGHRLVVGVALPTRAYAASLIAAGIVEARSKVDSGANAARHFKVLAEQQVNTPVRFREKDRVLNGLLAGVQTIEGEPRIGVCVSNRSGGSLTHWVREADVLRISLHTGEIKRLPKLQTGRRVIRSSFVRGFIPPERLLDFASRSDLECVIVGHVGVLRKEVEETPFVAQVGSQLESGTLQELLRVRKFQSADAPFRTHVLRAGGGKPDALPPGISPRVTLFDGSDAFLKWHEYWRHTHWVVLLDQGEAMLREAASVLYDDFVQRRVGEPSLKLSSRPPLGVEMMVFQERSR